MPEKNKERITEKSEGSACTESASGIAAARVPVRQIAASVLLLATSALFAIQVVLDVNHLNRVSAELSMIELRMIRRDIYNHDKKLMDEAADAARKDQSLSVLSEQPETPAEMEQRELSQQGARLHAYSKELSQEMDRQIAKMDDFLRRVYSDEAKYTRLRILVDSVWLVVSSLSAIVAFKRIAFSAFCSRLFEGLTLSCATVVICAVATGARDGYLNLFVWPLGVSSLGNSVFWPAAIMFLWSGVLLGLSLKGSEVQNGQQHP